MQGEPTVFCPRCGQELPEASKFCLKCGQPLSASANVSAPAKSRPSTGIVVLKLLGIAVLVFFAWKVAAVMTSAHRAGTPTLFQNFEHNDTITNSTFSVKPLSSMYFPFPVPATATNVSIDGHFTASGGLGNDIEVFVFNQDGFTNFQNHHQTNALYSSLRSTQGTFNVSLPSGAGTYYLVFSNNFSLLSAKSVQATGMLHYIP
jgi:hypothetical protein